MSYTQFRCNRTGLTTWVDSRDVPQITSLPAGFGHSGFSFVGMEDHSAALSVRNCVVTDIGSDGKRYYLLDPSGSTKDINKAYLYNQLEAAEQITLYGRNGKLHIVNINTTVKSELPQTRKIRIPQKQETS